MTESEMLQYSYLPKDIEMASDQLARARRSLNAARKELKEAEYKVDTHANELLRLIFEQRRLFGVADKDLLSIDRLDRTI